MRGTEIDSWLDKGQAWYSCGERTSIGLVPGALSRRWRALCRRRRRFSKSEEAARIDSEWLCGRMKLGIGEIDIRLASTAGVVVDDLVVAQSDESLAFISNASRANSSKSR